MKYSAIQKLLPLFRQSPVGWHLAMAAAMAHERGEVARRDAILALMTDDERQKARAARG